MFNTGKMRRVKSDMSFVNFSSARGDGTSRPRELESAPPFKEQKPNLFTRFHNAASRLCQTSPVNNRV